VKTAPYLVTAAEASNLSGMLTPLANGYENRIGHYVSAYQPWPASNMTVVR